MPHRASRPACPQMRIVGVIMGSAEGRSAAREEFRVRMAFCATGISACIGWRVSAVRCARARVRRVDGVDGRDGMDRKWGNRRMDVFVSFSVAVVDGNEDAVIRMLLNGSNASPPLPTTPFSPRMKSPAVDCSSSIRLVQSSLPVEMRT